jgi:phosphatidylserine decarboxylase
MRRIPIVGHALPYGAGLGVLFVLFLVLGWTFFCVLTLIAAALVLNFFRDPERSVPEVPNAIVAPADGKVIFVGKTFEDRFLSQETLKISIFMSIFDVHVNRVPCSGRVESIHYEKGTFFAANLEKSSRNNEHNAIVMQMSGEEKIVFVQIAGLIARRIDCRLQPGVWAERGERFGMIRFGSRLDIFVPSKSQPVVSKGQRVKAGESILCFHPAHD